MTIFTSAVFFPVKVLKGNIIPFTVDFTGVSNEEIVDLTVVQSSALFATLKSLFLDNSTNPNSVTITVSGTGQDFVAPAYSNGFYNIAATSNSVLTLSSPGGAATIANAQVYDYDIPSVVWLTEPAGSGQPITAPDGAIVTLGSKADAAVTNPAASGSLIALTKGMLSGINATVTGLGSILAQLVTGILVTRTSDYPNGATSVAKSSGIVSNAVAAASLPAVAAKTNFISGFDVETDGATAAGFVHVTVSGIQGATGNTLDFIYSWNTGLNASDTPYSIRFSPPLQCQAINTAIVVTVPALGAGNTAAIANVYGYVK